MTDANNPIKKEKLEQLLENTARECLDTVLQPTGFLASTTVNTCSTADAPSLEELSLLAEELQLQQDARLREAADTLRNFCCETCHEPVDYAIWPREGITCCEHVFRMLRKYTESKSPECQLPVLYPALYGLEVFLTDDWYDSIPEGYAPWYTEQGCRCIVPVKELCPDD